MAIYKENYGNVACCSLCGGRLNIGNNVIVKEHRGTTLLLCENCFQVCSCEECGEFDFEGETVQFREEYEMNMCEKCYINALEEDEEDGD